MNIILGSSSPRRKYLLKIIFDEFSIVSPEIDESEKTEETPESYCLRISSDKNTAVQQQIKSETAESLIITSDTIVAYRNLILQKPKNYEDALQTLMMLSGKSHRVLTSICISHLKNTVEILKINSIEETDVYFKNFNEETAKKYLSITKYMDKAGAYAIQENGDLIVEKFTGSQSNIVGLPMRLLLSNLIKHFNYAGNL